MFGCLIVFTVWLLGEICAQGSSCQELLPEYYNGTSEWAIQMIDATAALPSGLLNGNLQELGAFDQCLNIDYSDESLSVNGKYCLGAVVAGVRYFQLGVCIPSSCNISEVNIEIESTHLERITDASGNLFYIFDEDNCQTKTATDSTLTTEAIVAIVLLSVYASFVLASTLYDVYLIATKKSAHPIWTSFSVITNGKKVMQTDNLDNRLLCLDGICVLSMILIIYYNTSLIMTSGPIFNLYSVHDWRDTWHSSFMHGSNVTVDTLLLVTGITISYFALTSKIGGRKFNIWKYYLEHYLRVTPSYAAAILVVVGLLNYLGSGPYWTKIADEVQSPCKKYWWAALLYIQNYYNVDDMCIPATWYLAAYMQLILVSPIVLFLLLKFPKVAFGVIAILIAYSIAFPFYLAWYHELPALVTNIYGNIDDFYRLYYYVTYARAAPWIIGLLTGYFLYKIQKRKFEVKLHWAINLSLWIVAIGVMIVCLTAGQTTLRSMDYDRWGNAFHIALVRPSWSVAISCIIVACFSGHGGIINSFLSIPIFRVLGKQVLAAYILYQPVIFMFTYTKKTPFYFSIVNFMTEGGINVVYTMTVATVWVLLFQFPIMNLKQIVVDKRSPNRDEEEQEEQQRIHVLSLPRVKLVKY